jgi:NADPH:quinone reductase-like Zn-dependent oxidoreductase
VLGSNGWLREELVELVELVRQGKIKPVIDKELPLEDANEAFAMLEDRRIFGKVLLKP